MLISLFVADDLKAVTKRLIAQAKRQGSADNISIIVVFLKDPRDIAVDNRPPMDLGWVTYELMWSRHPSILHL